MTRKILYWLPRVLGIFFIIFMSVFALDAFTAPQWPLALLMHLIPSFILTLLLIIAWKHERLGGFLFLLAGLIMAIFFHSIVIAAPAFTIGILFLMTQHSLKI